MFSPARALKYLRKRNLIHRDLKPQVSFKQDAKQSDADARVEPALKPSFPI